MTETTTVSPAQPLVVEEGEEQRGFIGQNVPRKEDKRLVQGEGVFFDDVKRHEMGYVHFVRSPYAHARIKHVDVAKALELDGVYGTLTGDEVAILTDPFFELSVKPGADIKEGVHLADAAQRAWNRVTEYEHPKLQSVHLTQQPLDLSKLSDGQLAALERLVAAATLDRADQGGAPPTTH